MAAPAAGVLAPPPAADVRSRWRAGTLLRDPIAVASGLFILAVVVVAVFAPLIAPYPPDAGSILSGNEGVSAAHWLGTDSFGRDVLSRLIYGARLSLLGPALIIAISTVAGTALAIAAAWFGGWLDQVVSRVADILFAFPGLIFAMIAVTMFGPGLIAPVIALSISYTPYLMRVVRAAAIRQRALPYVSACYVEGLPGWRICLRHLLPNVAPILLVQATLSFGYALVDLAAVSYLGLGVQPPTAEWGLMVSEGQSAILAGHPQESLTAGVIIILTVVAFNLFGDRLAARQAVER
jgi:peptide/nickel transport system permease protein